MHEIDGFPEHHQDLCVGVEFRDLARGGFRVEVAGTRFTDNLFVGRILE